MKDTFSKEFLAKSKKVAQKHGDSFLKGMQAVKPEGEKPKK